MWFRLFSTLLMFVLCAVQAQPARALVECRGLPRARCSHCLKSATDSSVPTLRVEGCLIKKAPSLQTLHRAAPRPSDAVALPVELPGAVATVALVAVAVQARQQVLVEPEPEARHGPPRQRTLPLLC